MTKQVGDVDAWPGKLDGIKFYAQCLKEPDYIMSLMSTYGTLERSGDTKKRTYEENGAIEWKEFKYPEVVLNHFQFCNAVDASNSSRMSPIAIEETWKTTR